MLLHVYSPTTGEPLAPTGVSRFVRGPQVIVLSWLRSPGERTLRRWSTDTKKTQPSSMHARAHGARSRPPAASLAGSRPRMRATCREAGGQRCVLRKRQQALWPIGVVGAEVNDERDCRFVAGAGVADVRGALFGRPLQRLLVNPVDVFPNGQAASSGPGAVMMAGFRGPRALCLSRPS